MCKEHVYFCQTLDRQSPDIAWGSSIQLAQHIPMFPFTETTVLATVYANMHCGICLWFLVSVMSILNSTMYRCSGPLSANDEAMVGDDGVGPRGINTEGYGCEMSMLIKPLQGRKQSRHCHITNSDQ